MDFRVSATWKLHVLCSTNCESGNQGDADGDPREDVTRFGPECALTSCTTQRTRQSAAASSLQQNDEDQK